MVSEKVIIVLITLAIILCVVSMLVTFASFNSPQLVQPKVKINTIPGKPTFEKAQVSFSVQAPPVTPTP